jgi:ribosome-associated heat shock protein Hsp15
MNAEEPMRFDVLLHELRLFKSRSQATAAVWEGWALLNGERTKPSHNVRPGDRITLIGRSGQRTLEVLDLPGRALSKGAARSLVREVTEK